MPDTTTKHMSIIATMLRGNPTLAPYADDVEAIAAERDALQSKNIELKIQLSFLRAEIETEKTFWAKHIPAQLATARNDALDEAAREAMAEDERRIALASIRIPAMASEISDAILALKTKGGDV